MRIHISPDELDDRGLWDKAREMLGIAPWAISEGTVDYHSNLVLTEEQATQLGLITELRQLVFTSPGHCRHCDRLLGGPDGRYAKLPSGEVVCRPDRPDRMNCFEMVTTWNETLGYRRAP